MILYDTILTARIKCIKSFLDIVIPKWIEAKKSVMANATRYQSLSCKTTGTATFMLNKTSEMVMKMHSDIHIIMQTIESKLQVIFLIDFLCKYYQSQSNFNKFKEHNPFLHCYKGIINDRVSKNISLSI